MKKLLTVFWACVFIIFLFVGCSNQTLQLQEENVALREQVVNLERSLEQIQRYAEQQREQFGHLTGPTCGLTMVEIVEHTPSNLELVIYVCRMTSVIGILAQEQLSESGIYQIRLQNTLRGFRQGFNPLFERLYSESEVHALISVPERLESANIRFSWGRDSQRFNITISSDVSLRIDESRIDMDNLPQDEIYGPYFPNIGGSYQTLRFAIPILVGEY